MIEKDKPTAKKGLKNTIRKMLASKTVAAKTSDGVKADAIAKAPSNPSFEAIVPKQAAVGNVSVPKQIIDKTDDIPLGWKVEFAQRSNAGKLVRRIKEQSTLKNKDQKS